MNLNFNKGKIKRNILSIFNNKHSNCITPEKFNPLINYKESDSKKRKRIYSNKDHFKNMTPTQLYKYRPHVKRPMYSHYLESQIDCLPGSKPPYKSNINTKKTGKKMFKTNIFEESKDIFDMNWNNFKNNKKYKNNNIINFNNKRNKISQVYEFDNPVISYNDIGKKDKNSKFNN